MAPTVVKKAKNDEKLHCEYRIYLSILKETIVGIYPKLAEDLTENALKNNYLHILPNVQSYRRETPIYIEGKVDSRFDFSGIDSNCISFIMEVKNVPLADYEDISRLYTSKKPTKPTKQTTKTGLLPLLCPSTNSKTTSTR